MAVLLLVVGWRGGQVLWRFARREEDRAHHVGTAARRRLIARLRRDDLTQLAGHLGEFVRTEPEGALTVADGVGERVGSWPLEVGVELEDRIVLAAHNGHTQRTPGAWPGTPTVATMGMHLADRLGQNYLVIGTTNDGTGHTLNTGAGFYSGELFTELESPRPGSLDALLAASGDRPFAIDLRRLSPADTGIVRAVSQQRLGTTYCDVNPLDTYDILVHLPHVSAAEPDAAALAGSPHDVREAFAQWQPPQR